MIREVHAGVCGLHMGAHMLTRKIMRLGYFWLTMETDCCQYVQKCLMPDAWRSYSCTILRVACFDIAMAILSMGY